MDGLWGVYDNIHPANVQAEMEACEKEIDKWRGYRANLLEAQDQLKRVGKVSLRLTPPTPSIPTFVQGHRSTAGGQRIAPRCTSPHPYAIRPNHNRTQPQPTP